MLKRRLNPVPEPTPDAPSPEPDYGSAPPVVSKLKNVAILIGTSGSYGRGLLRGIAKYNREHAGWSTHFYPQTNTDVPAPWTKQWHGDGVLAHVNFEAYSSFFSRLKAPAVNLRLSSRDLPYPYVGVDHAKVGEMAAEHLLSLGIEQFGAYGSVAGLHAGLDERLRAFRQVVEKAGRTCAVFAGGRGPTERDWEQAQAQLAAWIKSLPKPVGLMASNDERGLQILDACRRCGARVPDEVAVIGVDNDEMLCEMAIPPLSSIDVNGERIGYEAAARLDAMMAGNDAAPKVSYINPRGVVTRRSTDVIASEDPEVNRAISFIREHGGRAINVVDVLAHLNMSRASLQQRMKRVLGHTIHEEIERVRLARVKDLLIASDMTIKQITLQTGFSSVQYMTRVFRAAVGETPAQFRRQRRG